MGKKLYILRDGAGNSERYEDISSAYAESILTNLTSVKGARLEVYSLDAVFTLQEKTDD